MRDCVVVHGADIQDHRRQRWGAGVVDRKPHDHNGPTETAPSRDLACLLERVQRPGWEDQAGTWWDT